VAFTDVLTMYHINIISDSQSSCLGDNKILHHKMIRVVPDLSINLTFRWNVKHPETDHPKTDPNSINVPYTQDVVLLCAHISSLLGYDLFPDLLNQTSINFLPN
jgi:hypothetical protein